MTTITVNQTSDTRVHTAHQSRDRTEAMRWQLARGPHVRRFTSSHAAAEWIKAEREMD